jgi:Tol biopolymer transport system component
MAALPGRNGTILAPSGVKLYSVSADGRRKLAIPQIRVLRSQDAAEAAWSPDGTRIAFAVGGGGIFVADTAGGRIKRIAQVDRLGLNT